MLKRAKLMVDYQCWCIWDMDEPRNVNPDTLAISQHLQTKLHKWESEFDATLDLTNHTKIGFKSKDEQSDFYDRGWLLFEELKAALPEVEW